MTNKQQKPDLGDAPRWLVQLLTKAWDNNPDARPDFVSINTRLEEEYARIHDPPGTPCCSLRLKPRSPW